MVKTPITMIGNGLTFFGATLGWTGIGLAVAGLGVALSALGNSIQVNPTTGERATKMTDKAALDTAIGSATSFLGGAAYGAAAQTANAAQGIAGGMNVAAQGTQAGSSMLQNAATIANYASGGLQAGMQYDAKGNFQGLDFSGFNGTNAALAVGTSFATNKLGGALAGKGASQIRGAVANSVVGTALNTSVEYYKHTNWGAQYSNYTSLASPGLGAMGGLAGSLASIQVNQAVGQQVALYQAERARQQNNHAQAAQILAGAGFSRSRRDELLDGYETKAAAEYYESQNAKFRDLYKGGHVEQALAIKDDLRAKGFNTDAADNYQAYINKDYLRNKQQKGYFTAASKMGANGFDEARGLFYKQSTSGTKTYIVPAGDNVRLVAAHNLPTTGGPNASHMSGSSVTYSGGEVISIRDPQKFAQWEFAQQVGNKLGLSAGESNYANVMSMFGTQANAEAYLRGEDYDDRGLPGQNAAWENRQYSSWWDRAVSTASGWSNNADDRTYQPGYGWKQLAKDMPGTFAGYTMQITDAFLATPFRSLVSLPNMLFGVGPDWTKKDSDYNVESLSHQKQLSTMGDIAGTITGVAGIRMAAGLMGGAGRGGAYAFGDLVQGIQRRYSGRMIAPGEGIPTTTQHGMQISRGQQFSIADDLVGPYPLDLDSQLARKHLWTMDDDGIRVIREKSGIKGFARGGDATHTNLSGGQTSRAGGEVWFTDTNSVRLNAASRAFGAGHSTMPLSRSEYANVIRAWRNFGYKVDAVPLGLR